MFCTILRWNSFATLGPTESLGKLCKRAAPSSCPTFSSKTDLFWKWIQYEIPAEYVPYFSSFWQNTGTVRTLHVWSTCKGTKNQGCADRFLGYCFWLRQHHFISTVQSSLGRNTFHTHFPNILILIWLCFTSKVSHIFSSSAVLKQKTLCSTSIYKVHASTLLLTVH